MRSTVIAMATRQAISAALAVSGVINAYLYVNGYRGNPMIGPGSWCRPSSFVSWPC